MDLVGPLPVSKEGFLYLFTMVDRSTRWAEAIPLSSITAADCAAALFTGWVARFGVPELLTSDRGVQFTSAVWSSLCSLLGIQHITTTAYHPQANGMVERFHRQLKNSLRARLCGPSWTAHLPWVMLGLRAAPKEDSGLSSAEMVYGAALTLPGQFLAAQEPPPEKFLESLQQTLSNFRPPQTRPPPERPPIPDELARAKFVYVRRGNTTSSLEPLYDGPYAVVESGGKVFRIRRGGQEEVVAVDRLKPHLGAAAPELAVPPRRGRPPLSPILGPRLYAEVVKTGCGQPE